MNDWKILAEILNGPAGAAVLLALAAYWYWKFYKPAEDRRIAERENRLMEMLSQQGDAYRKDIDRVIASCKDQMNDVIMGHERGMKALAEAIKENTRAAREVYSRRTDHYKVG